MFRLSDMIHSAHFSALADTIYWLKEHPIDLPWLQIPLTDTLRTLLTPTMVNLQQQTELQIATECPPQQSSENKTSHSAYHPHPVSRIGLNIFSQDKETSLDT